MRKRGKWEKEAEGMEKEEGVRRWRGRGRGGRNKQRRERKKGGF